MTFARIVALGLHLMVATCCENGSFDKNNRENSCITTSSIFWFHVSHRLRCWFLLWKDTSACVQHFTFTIFRHYCLLLLWKHHFSAEGNPSYTAIEKQQLFEMSYRADNENTLYELWHTAHWALKVSGTVLSLK